MIVAVKKLYPYKGFMGVKLKDYEVKKALEYQEKLVIVKDQEKMTIPYEKIEERIIDKSVPIPSKIYEGSYYSLWGFKWKPDKQEKRLTKEEMLKIAMS